jgi:hypothetical protein
MSPGSLDPFLLGDKEPDLYGGASSEEISSSLTRASRTPGPPPSFYQQPLTGPTMMYNGKLDKPFMRLTSEPNARDAHGSGPETRDSLLEVFVLAEVMRGSD